MLQFLKNNSHVMRQVNSQRVDWPDAARGLCIILVVLGHVIGGIRDAHLIPVDGFWDQVFNYIYTFHMPAFFFLSGLFAFSLQKKTTKKFLKDILVKLYFPCVVWSSIQMLAFNLWGDLVNHPNPFTWDQLRWILLGQVSQFWFIQALIIMQVIYYLFTRFVDKRFVLVVFLVLFSAIDLPLFPSFLTSMAKFAVYYGVGALFSDAIKNGPSKCVYPWLLSLFAGGLWFLFASSGISVQSLPQGWISTTVLIMPSSIMGTIFICALALNKKVYSFEPLLYIGRNTMPIYVMHVLIVAGTRIVMTKILGITEVTYILPLAFMLGVVGPLVSFEIMKRLRIQRYFGL